MPSTPGDDTPQDEDDGQDEGANESGKRQRRHDRRRPPIRRLKDRCAHLGLEALRFARSEREGLGALADK